MTVPLNAGIGESVQVDPLPFPTFNDTDIFISQENKNKIWNGEYIDFTLLLKQNFIVDHNPTGPIGVQNSQLVLQSAQKRIKQISNIEMWTDAFINFMIIYIEKHPETASALLSYMSTLRGVAADNQVHKWVSYDQQFRLRMAKNPNKSWSTIDGHLWLICGLIGHAPIKNQSNLACYDYNYKGFCEKFNCLYTHTCIKCSMAHPIVVCPQLTYKNVQQGVHNGYNANSYIQPNQMQYAQSWQGNPIRPIQRPAGFIPRAIRPQLQNHRSQLPSFRGNNPVQRQNFRPQSWYMGPR